MDILFNKVFNNKLLFKYIFYFVKILKPNNYKSLDNISLRIVFSSPKLFELKYASYKYYKQVLGDKDACEKLFLNLANGDNLKYFYESNVIENGIFIELYNDLKQLILLNKNYSKHLLLESLVFIGDRDRIKVFKDSGDLEFEINSIKSFIDKLFGGKKLIQVEYLQFILDLINNYSNNIEGVKNYWYRVLFDLLFSSIEKNQIQLYEFLFKQCLEYLEVSVKKKVFLEDYNIIFMYHKKLIQIIVDRCDLEMANIYVKYFKNQKLIHQKKFKFENHYNSIKVYSIFVSNGVLDPIHYPFKSCSYIMHSSYQDFKLIVDYYKDENIKVNFKKIISSCRDKETLQFLIKEQSTLFSPPLIFNVNDLVSNAAHNKDYQLVLFIFDQFNPPHNFSIKYTSFEIFKFFFERNQNFIFNDILINGYNNEIDYAKYIVERFKNGDPRVNLSYRSLKYAIEFGFIDIAIYLFKEIGHLGINRDIVNGVVNTGNIEFIELIKNTQVSQSFTEEFTIYDSTFLFIKHNKRYDILDALNNSIYKQFFSNFKI